jgi:hypothetical protein
VEKRESCWVVVSGKQGTGMSLSANTLVYRMLKAFRDKKVVCPWKCGVVGCPDDVTCRFTESK